MFNVRQTGLKLEQGRYVLTLHVQCNSETGATYTKPCTAQHGRTAAVPLQVLLLLNRSAGSLETLRRLSSEPPAIHSQSAAPGIRPAPHRTVSLRIQVSFAGQQPDWMTA